MGHSSILGPDPAPIEAEGRDDGALGPGDTSDSGSDSAGDPVDEATDADIGIDRVFKARRLGDRPLPRGATRVPHDDEDADLAFIDRAQAGDPFDAEDEPETAEVTASVETRGRELPAGASRGARAASPPPAPPSRPNPEPDVPERMPEPGGDPLPPPDEHDAQEHKPGRTAARHGPI